MLLLMSEYHNATTNSYNAVIYSCCECQIISVSMEEDRREGGEGTVGLKAEKGHWHKEALQETNSWDSLH